MSKKNNKSTAFLPWCHDANYVERKKNGNFEKVKRFVALPRSLLKNINFQSLQPISKIIYIYMLDWACRSASFNISIFTCKSN